MVHEFLKSLTGWSTDLLYLVLIWFAAYELLFGNDRYVTDYEVCAIIITAAILLKLVRR